MRINANEGLAEKQLVKVFLNRIGEFYESKGIRLMEKDDTDDFMRLMKNLCGGITQIMKYMPRSTLAAKIKGRSNPPPTTWTPTTCMVEPCIA